MKKMLLGLALLITACFTNTHSASAQVVGIDSVTNITTTSLDVWGYYDFTPDSTGATYFKVADNIAMVGAISSATVVHFDTTGTWMASFTGLESETMYYIEPNGITVTFAFFTGPIATVTTDTVFTMPSVLIDSLSGITTTSVTVNNAVGTGNDTLQVKVTTSTNASFTAGLTFGNVTVPNGTTVVPITITSLISNTDYWVKTEVSNRIGTVTSSILTFTTLDAGIFSVPVSDTATVTDTTVTMYGSANVAQKYWFIHGTDYFSVAVLHAGEVEGYTIWGGGAVTSASATFLSDPSTIHYWAFVTEYSGNVTYGTTLSITTLPIDTPILSLTIPIVADTNATAIAFYSSTESASVFIKYGQPTLGIGTQYTTTTYVGIGTGTLTETLHDLLAGTSGEAQLCAIVHGDTVTSEIASFVTAPSGAVIAFSGYITAVDVDPLFTTETIHFAFISENDLATVWVDIADSSDVAFTFPYPGGIPNTFQSFGGTAYDTIGVAITLTINHAYRCRISGYNSANGTIFSSASFLFDTYQDATLSSFYATPTTIDAGHSATLHWTTSNASSVTISGLGIVSNSGTISTGTLATTTDFILTAIGLSGNVVVDTVTVNVNPTGVEIVEVNDLISVIFNDQFSLSVPISIGSMMSVYNLNGAKIFESEISSEVSRFDINEPAGMYIATFVDLRGLQVSKKLIIAH